MHREWTASQIAADIGRLGYPKVALRSDQEPAITAVADKVNELRDASGKETDIEWVPRHDKGVLLVKCALAPLAPLLRGAPGIPCPVLGGATPNKGRL